MVKARPKYPTDLYGTIYIDNNNQKAVVICLIIPTILFPFDAGSSIKNYPDVWRTLSILDPESKGNVVGMTFTGKPPLINIHLYT